MFSVKTLTISKNSQKLSLECLIVYGMLQWCNPLCCVTVAKYLGLAIQLYNDYHLSKARVQLYCIWHLQLSAYLFGLMY